MNESKLFGVSFRGILALVVIATVCVLSYRGIKVDEPLYSLVLVVSSAYFGSKTTSQKPEEKPNGNT